MPVIELKSAPCRIPAECIRKALHFFKSIRINLVTLRAEEGCFDGYAEEITSLIRNEELAYSFSIDAGWLHRLTNQISANAIAPAGIAVRLRTKEEISACGLADAVKILKSKRIPVKVGYIPDENNFEQLLPFVSALNSLNVPLYLGKAVHGAPLTLDKKYKLHFLLSSVEKIYRNKIYLNAACGMSPSLFYCRNLEVMDNLSLAHTGELFFCNALPADNKKAVAGNILQNTHQEITDKFFEFQTAILQLRMNGIFNKELLMFNDCSFCNAYFTDQRV